jgi:superfamily II DNA/RNA helicase
VEVYDGTGRSGIFLEGQWRTADREEVNRAVREYQIRLVVATDAAAGGVNLQTLTSLINVDLPWKSIEARTVHRSHQALRTEAGYREQANLVYPNTVGETVYDKLSSRMKDRYALLGSLPEVIDDEWIDDVEAFEEGLRDLTRKKKNTADRDEADNVLSSGW